MPHMMLKRESIGSCWLLALCCWRLIAAVTLGVPGEDEDEATRLQSAFALSSSQNRCCEVAEVNPSGSPPLSFHGYRRGRELGQGGSSQVFVCSQGPSEMF